MWRWIAVVAGLAACVPLGPGETRCTTSEIGGTSFTRCKSAAPERSAPPPAAAPRPAAPAVERAPVVMRWWCLTIAVGSGACYRDRGECQEQRDAAYRNDDAITAQCEQSATASCFSVVLEGGSIGEMCHPGALACFNQRDYVLDHPEQATALTGCAQRD